MAYRGRRKYGKGKSKGRKRSYRKKRSNSDKHVYKLRGVVIIASNSSGLIQDVFSTSQPGAYFNGASALPDLSSLTALYDAGRICAIKLKYVPSRPNSSLGTFTPLYVMRDDDDHSACSTVSEAVQYGNCKVKNLWTPWTYYTKIPRTFGIETGNPVVVGSLGWYDLAQAQAIGSIKLFSQSLDTVTEYGQIVATYYIAFKGRR